MEQNLENMLQAALSDYVKFRIEVTNPMVIWLPFAGHKRPPHITSQVTRLQFGVMSVSSCDPHDRAHPEDFECGLFVQSGTEFPSTTADFSQHGTERPFASQKFKTPPERILYPVNVNCPLALHDSLESPKVIPQFELFLQLSPIKGEMNRLQYNYLSSVVSERLTLNRHKLTVAKSQSQKQKTERKEASDQRVTNAVVTAQLEPQRTPNHRNCLS
jgi:hypothetical protein